MSTSKLPSPENPGIFQEFVIGVTGHRDLTDYSAVNIRSSLRTEIESLRQNFPHVPIRLVSGLAEGADTLATRIALELEIEVLAVLPMPQIYYRDDFEGAALQEFEEILSNEAVSVVEIPLAAGVGPDDIKEQNARDAQYELLASYLTRRSNILFALWDGETNGLPGGTSDVVMRYLSDGRDITPNQIERSGKDAEGCGNIVFWMPAIRENGPQSATADAPVYLISNANYDCYWQTKEVPDQILTRWRGLRSFFQERDSDRGKDLPAYGLAGQSADLKSADLDNLSAEYVRADQMARAYQSKSHLMFALFGLLAAGMGLAFLIYAKLLADKNFLYIYIGLFAAGFVGFRYTHRLHLHSKHLAYRALAETFRVQFYLILSGAGNSYNPRRLLGLTSVDQFQRFEWLQDAIRLSEPVVYFGHCKSDEILNVVNREWIVDQLAYFEKKRHLLHKQHHRLERIKLALLVGSVIGAFSLIFFKKTLIQLDMAGYDGKAWLVFFMGLLPLWAAVWELYQGKMATRELLWQYANQSRYFRAATQEIEQAPTLQDGQKVIRDLADKALVEIYMWSVHRFHREHEPPAAG